jgi:hypothetical protein
MIAPVGSVMMPEMVACGDCARSRLVSRSEKQAAASSRRNSF